MERTRYRIEVGRQGLEAIEDANGSWEYHADAQRALDAEREKVKELECYRALWKRRDDELTGVLAQRAALQARATELERDNAAMKQLFDANPSALWAQLATLQAQLAQPIRVCQGCGRVSRDGWVTARYECDELRGSLQCPDCQCIDLEINTAKELATLCTQAQAQLRQVEGERAAMKGATNASS